MTQPVDGDFAWIVAVRSFRLRKLKGVVGDDDQVLFVVAVRSFRLRKLKGSPLSRNRTLTVCCSSFVPIEETERSLCLTRYRVATRLQFVRSD